MCVCVCECECVCVCVCVCAGARALNYVMITCANHDVLANNILPVSILVIEHCYNTVENTDNMSLFCCFALPALVIH